MHLPCIWPVSLRFPHMYGDELASHRLKLTHLLISDYFFKWTKESCPHEKNYLGSFTTM